QLAFANRKNQLFIHDLENGDQPRIWTENFGFAKRMKWKDAETLWFVGGGYLYEIKMGSNAKRVIAAFPNTIEDFAWDAAKRYLIIVSYTRHIYLCDYESGEVLHEIGDQIDYSKGVFFLEGTINVTGYPADFVVFGRARQLSYNRIHDNRIVRCGFI